MTTTHTNAIAVYAPSPQAMTIAMQLQQRLPSLDLYTSEASAATTSESTFLIPDAVGPTLARYAAHVLVMSLEAAIRFLAPYLRAHDSTDTPAVVCVDSAGRFAISLLTGEHGRGDGLCERIAHALAAQAVVTSPEPPICGLSLASLGKSLGWTLDDPERNLGRAQAALRQGMPALFVQQAGEADWWPLTQQLPHGMEYSTDLETADPSAYAIVLIASDRELRATHPALWTNGLIYRPKTLVVGMGCDRHLPEDVAERGIASLLARYRLSPRSVKALATTEAQRAEPALLRLSKRHGWPLYLFSARELDAAAGIENSSDHDRRHWGANSVAESACLLAAGAHTLLVPRQAYTEPSCERSMTLAIARVPATSRGATDRVIPKPTRLPEAMTG